MDIDRFDFAGKRNFEHKDDHRSPFAFDSDVTVVDSDTEISPPERPSFGFGHDRRPPFAFDSDVTVADSDTDIAPPERPDFGFDFGSRRNRPFDDYEKRPNFGFARDIDDDDDFDDDDEGHPLFNFAIEQPQFGKTQEPWFAHEDNFAAPEQSDGELDAIISEKPFEQSTAPMQAPFDVRSLDGKRDASFAAQGHSQPQFGNRNRR